MLVAMEMLLVCAIVCIPVIIICGSIDVIFDDILGLGVIVPRLMMLFTVFVYASWLSDRRDLPIAIARAIIEKMELL